ncbi:MAG: right-handed parallel beta-helix repeat-containing protein [Spirochaetales bacterium]|nr:right-handed parallel beta-helix repeat-containing protein [Spirochaetales bacterium]
MKKSLFVLFIAVLAFSMVFVSCKSEPTPVDTGDDGFLHVSTFNEFVKGLSSAKKTDSKTLVLDADIEWDATKYPGGGDNVKVDETYTTKTGASVQLKQIARLNDNSLSIDVTGLTIDLGGHTISGVPKNAFNLTGNSFTLKNGSILSGAGNDRYSININYNGSNASTSNGLKEVALDKTPASYSDTDAMWKKRVIVDNITATSMLCGYTTVEIKNCTFTGSTYRGLVLQGSSGTVENVTVDVPDASSAGFVAHSYDTVLVKGTNSFKGAFGIYAPMCSTLIIDSSAVVTATGAKTYAFYLETQGNITINSGATVTLVPAADKATFYMRTGTTIDIAAGAVLKDSTGTAIAKPIPAAAIDSTGNGASDNTWKGYGVAPVITDNRT